MSNKRERVMVKFGSLCVVDNEEGGAATPNIDDYCAKIAFLHSEYDVLITTSGAVARASRLRHGMNKSSENVSARTLASNGNALIISDWIRGLSTRGLIGGEVLVTHRDLKKKKTRKSFISAYDEMRQDGTIPVINCNDVMTRLGDNKEELARLRIGGDNDWLAARAAALAGASAILFCTSDVNGVEIEGEVQPIIRVSDLEDVYEHMRPGSDEGSGSMLSKVKAAAWAVKKGSMSAYICNAAMDYASVLNGESIATQVIQ